VRALSGAAARLRQWLRGGRGLFLLFLAWPMVLVSTSGPPMADSVLLAAIRLVDHGTWTLSDQADPKAVFLTLAHDISVHDGRVYSGVGPGASVVAAPFYFVFKPLYSLFDDSIIANRRVAHYYAIYSRARGEPVSGHFKDMYLLQILLAWCVVAPLFATFLTRLHRAMTSRGVERTPAAVVVVAIGIGSMALYYGSMYSRQALAYLLLWHAILLLVETPAPGRRACVVAGLFCGAAVSIDYPAIILAGLFLLFRLPRMTWPQRTMVLLPVLAVAGLTGLYHAACFGSPLATPYQHRYWVTSGILADPVFQEGAALGLDMPSPGVMLRLCFGLFKGLFIYSPILLPGLVGHVAGLRSPGGRRLHIFSLLVFLIYLSFNSTLGAHVPNNGEHFWGGLSILWGPRHLFAVVPFLACGLARLDWRRASVRWVCLGALLASCLFNVLGTMFGPRIMSTPAFGPELRFPLRYAFRLFIEQGPRIPILDCYGVAPLIQTAVILALVLFSLAVLRETLGETPR